jgi:hypothetical protein
MTVGVGVGVVVGVFVAEAEGAAAPVLTAEHPDKASAIAIAAIARLGCFMP